MRKKVANRAHFFGIRLTIDKNLKSSFEKERFP
ncbi:hypothetical protein BP1258A_1882 [Burkholderia pseudomallei 1258a]|uniref:Uncharacterized protein n=1 Tax=Burkholderia pseudomallei (strain 1026b) TaxID=884204 RepID=A0A0H3HKN6_BURP2|nr:hypothetical protein BP1026B_I2277 [Burkholderia pseudomallei 1026b]AFR15294.1 hypothetical protein BPC006_I1415 [Burkholderia pseudomallei BPC006]EIF53700.1 hypothetical protein BP1026A_5511 [Burkholderia pseudomallei 1026a]EIF63947.1 hypothetical protein BP1258A_1882 [Burkholderia pseudomallei 1258a]EIF65977.1 hypothetical protein BP1258B_1975 [Burkholderia pseudomallei 1258b]EIF76299.1 hypothetical protein BP354E_1755 [Burkholderia pseudomallei 354e]EIF80682.1 hypothetical protein BP354